MTLVLTAFTHRLTRKKFSIWWFQLQNKSIGFRISIKLFQVILCHFNLKHPQNEERDKPFLSAVKSRKSALCWKVIERFSLDFICYFPEISSISQHSNGRHIELLIEIETKSIEPFWWKIFLALVTMWIKI